MQQYQAVPSTDNLQNLFTGLETLKKTECFQHDDLNFQTMCIHSDCKFKGKICCSFCYKDHQHSSEEYISFKQFKNYLEQSSGQQNKQKLDQIQTLKYMKQQITQFIDKYISSLQDVKEYQLMNISNADLDNVEVLKKRIENFTKNMSANEFKNIKENNIQQKSDSLVKGEYFRKHLEDQLNQLQQLFGQNEQQQSYQNVYPDLQENCQPQQQQQISQEEINKQTEAYIKQINQNQQQEQNQKPQDFILEQQGYIFNQNYQQKGYQYNLIDFNAMGIKKPVDLTISIYQGNKIHNNYIVFNHTHYVDQQSQEQNMFWNSFKSAFEFQYQPGQEYTIIVTTKTRDIKWIPIPYGPPQSNINKQIQYVTQQLDENQYSVQQFRNSEIMKNFFCESF